MSDFNALQIPISETGQFPKILIDYLHKNADLADFYDFEPSLSGIEKRIKSGVNKVDRTVLFEALKNQHLYINDLPEAILSNIELIRNDNTFTITTGHQLNIFSGPLYLIFKLISVIKLCSILKQKYPDHNFVPVYWMATEDHDIAEIDHFNFVEQTFKWNHNYYGPAGRMPLSGFNLLNDEIQIILNGQYADELKQFISNSYLSSQNLAEATRKWVYNFLGEYGLVVLDPDTPMLKKKFIPVIEEEIFNQPSFDLVNQVEKQWSGKYTVQVHPREINFFFLENNYRERIIKENVFWKTIDGKYTWTKVELQNLIHTSPEKFSPNVILRPLYQETVLPNIIYLGGPAEVNYWLQYKKVFHHFHLKMPVVLFRDSAMIIDSYTKNKIDKLSLSEKDIFMSTDELIRHYVTSNNADINLDDIRNSISEQWTDVVRKAKQADVTLSASAEAELQKILNGINALEGKILKAVKKKEENAIQQIRTVKTKLFPENVLLERRETILPLYLKYGKEFIKILMENFDPLSNTFNILIENPKEKNN